MPSPRTASRPRPGLLAPAAGAVVWLAVLALAAGSVVHLTTFQLFLVLGPLVVVPLGLPLVIGPTERRLTALVAVGGLFVVASVVAPPGPGSTALSLPWLVLVTGVAALRLDRLRRAGRAGDASLRDVVATAGCAWLIVGATSLTMSRAGATLFGVSPELVELGAMHFSFAGFAAAVLAAEVLRHSDHHRIAGVAAVATVGGAGVVALGHVTVRPLELAGAVTMTVGIALIGLLSWSLAPPRSAARILLRIAALGVIVPMALAIQYAWALTTGTGHPPYETIARIHGSLNAFAFSIGGLVAWRLLDGSTGDPRPGTG